MEKLVDSFFVIKDPHNRFGFNVPISRQDTYFDEIKDKYKHLKELGKKYNVKKLYIAGDINDIKTLHLWLFKHTKLNSKVLEDLKEQFNIFTIAGNHDLPYSSKEYKQESVYQHYVDNNLINDIDNRYIVHKSYIIVGLDFESKIKNLEDRLKKVNAKFKRLKSKYPQKKMIVMFHEHITPNPDNEPELKYSTYFSYDYLAKKYKYIDMFIAGHYHKGYPTTTYKRKIFVNPFNFARLARSNYTLDGSHKPTVTMVRFYKNKDKIIVKYKDIVLRHKPFEEAIKIDKILEEAKAELSIDEFVSNINSLDDIKSMLSDDNLSMYDIDKLDEANLSDEVKEKIKYYISSAKESQRG